MPRVIAGLLAIDGLAYLLYSFADFLTPGLPLHLAPWIQLPAPLAEGAFSLWLLLFGVNLERWTESGATAPANPHQPTEPAGTRALSPIDGSAASRMGSGAVPTQTRHDSATWAS